MSELMNDFEQPTLEAEDEAPVQYFCKFTFAQFFTIMILAVFTLGFMFYLGSRYGNDYLRLGQAESSINSTTLTHVTPSTYSPPMDADKSDEMLRAAREALQQQQVSKLQGQADQVLQNPSAYQQFQQMQQQPGVVSVYSQQQPQQQGVVAPEPSPEMQPSVPTTTVSTPTNSRVNDYEPNVNRHQEVQALPQPQPIPQDPGGEEETVATIPVKPAGVGTFSVQVAASQDMAEANQWVQGWRDRGYSAYMMSADIPTKGRWYRVRLGTFPTKETAEIFASQLKEKEQVQAIAVQNE